VVSESNVQDRTQRSTTSLRMEHAGKRVRLPSVGPESAVCDKVRTGRLKPVFSIVGSRGRSFQFFENI
jgi:hypothetical protein